MTGENSKPKTTAKENTKPGNQTQQQTSNDFDNTQSAAVLPRSLRS